METVLGLLLLLLGVSRGEESDCDGRRSGAQCYGLLEGTVFLWLMDNATEIPAYDWEKEGELILKWRKEIVVNAIKSRSLFFPSNGTFRINNLNMNDSGEYTLKLFDSNRQQTGRRTLQLSIKEPKDPLIVLSGVLSVLLIFLIIGAAVIFIKKKNQSHKAEEDSDQELTYAEVSVVQPQGRQVKQKMEVEVEYGQVKFSEQPK